MTIRQENVREKKRKLNKGLRKREGKKRKKKRVDSSEPEMH